MIDSPIVGEIFKEGDVELITVVPQSSSIGDCKICYYGELKCHHLFCTADRRPDRLSVYFIQPDEYARRRVKGLPT